MFWGIVEGIYRRPSQLQVVRIRGECGRCESEAVRVCGEIIGE